MIRISINEQQQSELMEMRDTAVLPYLRERAAAILKIAAGKSSCDVATNGLLKKRRPETVREWLDRYIEQGIQGLIIKSGRGRKPSFSP